MKLIITTNLGLLRAYEEAIDEENQKPRLIMVKEMSLSEAHEKLSDQTSDQAGRFPRGSTTTNTTGQSYGERHGLEVEQTRQLINLIAKTIDELLADENVTKCWLAASAPIHKQIHENLNGKNATKIKKLVALDLVQKGPADLLDHLSKV